MPDVPYTCTGQENQGRVKLYEIDQPMRLIMASRCFMEYYEIVSGCTWEWENGVDPDDPTTWPQPPEPTEPPAP